MSEYIKNWPQVLLAVFFIFAGANHFIKPEFYLALIPPYLPAHEALNIISGLAEIAGGIGVLIPRLRKYAGIGLLLLLLAVFPANIHMAINNIQPPGADELQPWMTWARLPFQLVFLYWVYAVTLRSTKAPSSEAS